MLAASCFALTLKAQNPTLTQTSTASVSQAITTLQKSLQALAGNTVVKDVTLTGTAQRIAGSDDETGSVVLKAMATGESRMDVTLSSGTTSEIRVPGTNGPEGAWAGEDGVQHATAYHNLLTDSAWFFPALTLNRFVSTSGVVATYVGTETVNGQSAIHISVSHPPSGVLDSPASSALFQHLSQMEIYLDPTSFLPLALSFTTHPDENDTVNTFVQIRFSDYQSVGSMQVPLHIQKFINNGLALDLQLQAPSLNSGLTSSAFAVQATQ